LAMKRANVSGDCRMIANSPPQANTHSRAITINVVTKTCLVLGLVFNGRSAKTSFDIVCHTASYAIIGSAL
jgi:hypothetical protein